MGSTSKRSRKHCSPAMEETLTPKRYRKQCSPAIEETRTPKRPGKQCSPAMEETLTPNRSPPLTFQPLISAIQAPEGPKLPLLNRLYSQLVPLSLNEPVQFSNVEGVFKHCGVEVKHEDIEKLTHALFEELNRRFKLFFSALSDVSASKQIGFDIVVLDTADELPLLLRCCMLVLALANPKLLVEKTQLLLSVLGKLISLVTRAGDEKNSVSFQKLVSSKCTYTDADGSSTTVSRESVTSLCFIEPSDPWCPALSAVLEIFADELVMPGPLREYFILVDSTCTTERLFQCHFVKGDIGSVLEVISVHFISSVYGKRAYDNFLKRLFCEFGKHSRVPELSLTAGVSLLHNPIMPSAPKMLQTHLILLVSESIDVDMPLKNAIPDHRLMECYLKAFERSVHLYTSHMSRSLMDFNPFGVKHSCASSSMLGRSCQPSFESNIQQVTRDKIDDLVTKSDALWDLYLCNRCGRKKSDLLSTSVEYINESQLVFDESCKDDIFSFLRSIVLGSFSCDVSDTGLYKKGDTSPQDIYLLASIMKLMSASLLKVIWCLRHGGNLGSPKTLKDASSKEYDFVVGIIGCFHQFNMSLPHQKFLFDMMNTHPMKHKASKWMLLHFSGLLSLSFASGIDFLVKGCISTIMALSNLYVFEEGDIVALSSLLVSVSQTFSSGLSPDKVTEAVVKKKSTRRVALKFQKFQTLNLRKGSLTSFHQRLQSEVVDTSENACIMKCTRKSSDAMEEEEAEEICDGKNFLSCLLGSSKNSDIDDLADFIECKLGKDYSSWLKDRQRYQWLKRQKMNPLRLERKKNAWKSIKRERERKLLKAKKL